MTHQANGLELLERKRLLISRSTNLICISTSIIFSAIFIYFGYLPLIYIFTGYSLLYLGNFWLSYTRYQSASKVIVYVLMMTHALLLSITVGNQIETKIFYIPIVIVPFITFGKKERFLLTPMVIITLLNIFFAFFFDRFLLVDDDFINPANNQIINDSLNLVSVTSMIVLSYLFLSYSEDSEKLLMKSKDEIYEKNLMLELAHIEQVKLNKMKDYLFSVVSHDMKGPIHSLMGITEMLDLDRLNPDEIREVISKYKLMAMQTNQMLDNLLKWSGSQIMNLKPNLQEFNIATVLDSVIGQVEYNAKAKNIKIVRTFDEDMFVYADTEMIEIVLRNLLGNAVKFSKQHSEVELMVNKFNDTLKIQVADTGIGIPEELIPTIFEPDMGKRRTGTSNEKGAGIGLLLCKKLVDLNQGTILVETVPGQKTIFSVSLPLSSVDALLVNKPISEKILTF